jgi:hypothetical protein
VLAGVPGIRGSSEELGFSCQVSGVRESKGPTRERRELFCLEILKSLGSILTPLNRKVRDCMGHPHFQENLQTDNSTINWE